MDIYFKWTDVPDSIKCGKCTNILDSPVLLPCGDSICKKHRTNTQEPILCRKCGIEHEIPASGFPANNALARRVYTEIANLKIGNKQKAKQSCDKLDTVLTNFQQVLNDPLYFIYVPIKHLIDLVQLKGEEMIKEISDKMHRIISKLEEYKNECEKDLSEKEYLEKSDYLREEIEIGRQTLDNWLATLEPNEAEWRQIKCECETAITKFEKNLKLFKFDLFPNKFENFKDEIEKEFGKFLVDPSFNLWRTHQIELKSSIVTESRLKCKLLNLCDFEATQKFRLLYRGSLDGFRASNFHEKCDNIKKTLTIIKAAGSGNIFGGYTEAAWNHDSSYYKVDNKAFIFSLVNKEKKPMKSNISEGEDIYSIYGNKDYGPVFPFDIVIKDKSNSSNLNYSDFGNSYTPIPEYPPGSEAARNFLAGSANFKVGEIEVFQLL